MTFHELPIGESFLFVKVRRPQDTVFPSVFRKTGPNAYEGFWPDNTWIAGTVSGKMPVRPIVKP